MKAGAIILGVILASVPAAAEAQSAGRPHLYDNLGTHHRPISTRSPAAQRWFDQGLRWSYAFNHEEAVRAFAEGERLDSSCAMCAWGIAYALGPNINAPMPREAAVRAHAAISRARGRLAVATPVEIALVQAMSWRYQSDAPAERASLDSAYARAMQEVAQRFPADDDVQVIAAEALMDLAPWVYWTNEGTPRPDTPEIVTRLERVLGRSADHPGACHFYIHLVEAVMPERAVRCAERLASLMPGAGHMVHMPAHIYIRVGRFNDAIDANHHAVHADNSYFEGPAVGRSSLYGQGYAPHNWHFLTFASVMAGRSAVALDAAQHASDAIAPEVARAEPLAEAILPTAAITRVTFGRWDEILALPLPDPNLRFATGMDWYARGVALAAKGRFDEARAAADSVRAAATGVTVPDLNTALAVAHQAVLGEVALRKGRLEQAVTLFRRAVELEDGITYSEPPHWYYPMRHSLGKALLAAGRPAEAEHAYRADLVRFPENGWALFGLAQSLRDQGRNAEADKVQARFRAAWAEADVTLTASRF